MLGISARRKENSDKGRERREWKQWGRVVEEGLSEEGAFEQRASHVKIQEGTPSGSTLTLKSPKGGGEGRPGMFMGLPVWQSGESGALY